MSKKVIKSFGVAADSGKGTSLRHGSVISLLNWQRRTAPRGLDYSLVKKQVAQSKGLHDLLWWVSYLYRTAQPHTLARFLAWGIL